MVHASVVHNGRRSNFDLAGLCVIRGKLRSFHNHNRKTERGVELKSFRMNDQVAHIPPPTGSLSGLL